MEEIYLELYKNAFMGSYACEVVLKDINEFDNNIKSSLEEVLSGYQVFLDDWELKLEGNVDKLNLVEKMMTNIGIKKEVDSDNSDSHIADLMIKGIDMGIVDLEKMISSYDNCSKEEKDDMKKFLKFQKKSIKEMEKYL